jgi:hypothetical protein
VSALTSSLAIDALVTTRGAAALAMATHTLVGLPLPWPGLAAGGMAIIESADQSTSAATSQVGKRRQCNSGRLTHPDSVRSTSGTLLRVCVAVQMIVEFGNDDVRHRALRSPRPRAIGIIVFIQLAGSDLPATCRLVADFSKTRFDRRTGVAPLSAART